MRAALFFAPQSLSRAASLVIGFLQSGAGAILVSLESVLRDMRPTPRQFGAKGDGVTNDTAAFTLCRTFTGGRYSIGPGNYVLDGAPDVWSDPFIAHHGVTLTIGGTPFTVSGSIVSGWRTDVTQRYMTMKHARTGKDIVIWSDGELSGDSHRIFLPWDIRRDSHYLIASPETNGGTCDLLLRRSQANADPGGNRFGDTFNESDDSLQRSYATTASGAPSFESAYKVTAGPSAKIEFPALRPRFSQGIKVTTRADGNFNFDIVPATDRAHFRDGAGAITYMTFKADGSVGFNGSGGITKPTITGSRGGNAALTALLTQLNLYGLITDGTSA